MKTFYTFWFSLLCIAGWGQSRQPLVDLIFHPNYQLFGNAANYPGPRIDLPESDFGKIGSLPAPYLLKNEEPSQRLLHVVEQKKLPSERFSIEMWMVNHVNQPIGALATVRTANAAEAPHWLLGYFGKEIIFSVKDQKLPLTNFIDAEIGRGWKKYWGHLVATFDGKNAKLFFNGELKAQTEIINHPALPEDAFLELGSFMKNEPYMEWSNLVKRLRIYGYAISEQAINAQFNTFQQEVEKGIIFPKLFHFTAGPYLHYVTSNSINISWETDRQLSKAVIKYGEILPLEAEKDITLNSDPEIPSEDFIQAITLDNLKSGTNYFYELVLTDTEGQQISSGTLTFATAPEQAKPFTFAVIGDTEARPHVNFQVSKLIWDERPNFLINLGDLTDGGKEPHKFEWNLEYFTGMTALCSRIPIFPVAGNGESDLFWYKKYHKLPDPEGYYTFTYGDAQFFMMDSNPRAEFAKGGRQYNWLEEELKKSTAKWKFVCHHHAPYSTDENDYGNSWKEKSDFGDLKVRQIVPLYEKYKVDMVFFGHLHTYSRTMPILEDKIDKRNGVIYLQGGGGGGNLEDFAPNRAWFSAKTYRGHHYFTISLEGSELHMKMFDTEGRMRDFMTIEKENNK